MKLICPKCGKEVAHLMLPMNPPKYQNRCFGCGWVGEVRGFPEKEWEELAT